ncbi:hypothetical protein [Caldilinea sp.]|uniref:hypothetical protein n=1 Tax=Caldilinea sp. TaxID=2293560 RepID=UPI002CC86C75|nr:hypothetical protein [Caldilinea sp.]
MSTTTVFRIAGVSGILAALAMLALTFVSDPNSGMSPVYAVPNAVLGIIFVAGLYLLYRDQESALSLAAAAASVIGYLLFLAGSFMQLTYPSPILQAGDILIYIIGLSLFSWLAYRAHKMPRILAIVGFLTALVGIGSYLVMWFTGASFTSMENLPPLLMVLYTAYLIGVVVWLAWTGVSLLRVKAEAV